MEIAEKAGTRVIVHVTDCPLPLDEVAAMLRSGDVICHIYQNRGNHSCLDEKGKVLPGLWKARERGVLFDASNGRSNFDLEVARKAVEQGFVPDVISSDNNASSFSCSLSIPCPGFCPSTWISGCRWNRYWTVPLETRPD